MPQFQQGEGLSREYILRAIQNLQEDETCSDHHPGMSCNDKMVQQFMSGSQSLFKMYLVVHLVPLLVFKIKSLKK